MFEYSHQELANWLQVAIDAAIQSGKIISEALTRQRETDSKENPTDLVTITDKAVEEYLFKHLKKLFPTHDFIGEESSAATGATIGQLNDIPTW